MAQALESRLLLSASLIKDINVNPGGGEHDFTLAGNVLYFLTNTYQGDLWKTDGTFAGTAKLPTLVGPGYHGATGMPTELASLGSTLYFISNEVTPDMEYGVFAARDGGASELLSIHAGGDLNEVNGSLFFVAYAKTQPEPAGFYLWEIDKAGAPHAVVPFGSSKVMAGANGSVYFMSGTDLYRTDGTTAGTIKITAIAGAHSFMAGGSRLYVNAGNSLWTSDGTAAATRDLHDFSDTLVPGRVYNNCFYFGAKDAGFGAGLWKSDGTSGGTVLVTGKVTPAGAFAELNGKLYFAGTDAAHGTELWQTDGTAAGTTLVADINPGPASGMAATATRTDAIGVNNGYLYFGATDATQGEQLWRSNGTPSGTLMFNASAQPTPGVTAGGITYFSAFDGVTRFIYRDPPYSIYGDTTERTLWTTDGTAAGTSKVNSWDGPVLNPSDFYTFNGQVYFNSYTVNHSESGPIWSLTPAGDQVFYNSRYGLFAGGTQVLGGYGVPLAVQGMTAVGNTLYFVAFDPSASIPTANLYKSDGTPGGTVPVLSGGADHMLSMNGFLYFTSGATVWRSNGTAGGTTQVYSAPTNEAISALMTTNGALYAITSNNSTQVSTLARIEGNASTVVWSGPNSLQPRSLFPAGVDFYFLTNDPADSSKKLLYRSNGTPTGTLTLVSLPSIGNLRLAGGKLYFESSSSGKTTLYQTDGTPAGTRPVSPTLAVVPGSLFGVDKRVFFVATDGAHGNQLWVTDGATTALADPGETAAGWTVDTLLGKPSGGLVFAATDSQHGSELWSLPVAPSAASASLLKTDAVTQGNWTGTYGADGFVVTGGGASIPAYATTDLTGFHFQQWASTGATTDTRALQSGPAMPTRVAAADSSQTSFSLDLNLTDGKPHKVAFYLLDFDNLNRTETVQIANADSGQVLNTLTVGGFQAGKYLVYALTGHVKVTFTNAAGSPGAVLGGIFFDQALTPYSGYPFNIATEIIDADLFDNGGEGVAYHDTTPQNIGGNFRPGEAVDINSGGDNGFSVGYSAPGEWISYSITAPYDGAYVLQSRVANYKQGGTFHVEIDGVNVTGAMTVPDTGPWDTWQTLTSQAFNVSAGDHVMRVVMDQPGYWGNIADFDTFRFVPRAPFHGTPFNISTDTIQAEDFDNGSDGVAYHDTTPQNITGAYRSTGVDIAPEANPSNGFAVGYTAPGEWMNYTINAPAQGTYAFQARVANYQQGGTFHVEIDGTNVTGTMTVPDSGPWDTWTNITSQEFTVLPGTHLMRVVMDQPGYWGNIGDFDSFRFIARAPFHGTPFNIATDTIQAEDFDNGGEGVAYHDTTPQNIPGAYRNTAVDVAPAPNTSNGFAVGYTAPGEWLLYSITAPADGLYLLESRVANYKQGGTFHLEIDGKDVTGAITVPDTGGWNTWKTINSQAFNVSAGTHTMKVVMDTAGYWGNIADFDSFKFVVPVPFLGHPFKVGAETIEAENFDNGGEGIAFHDTTAQNQGGKYRSTAVDINAGGSSGFDVGYTAPGEWLKYSITNPTAGTFVLQTAVASSKPGGTFHVEIDGENVTGTLTVPDTGGWYTFQTLVSPKFTLAAGDHTMKVVMDSAGALGAVANFDYFRFVPAGIVTLVSQERLVEIQRYGPTNDTQVTQAEPGDFGPFDAQLAQYDMYHDVVLAQQSSSLNLTTSGGQFTASLAATDGSSLDGLSSFHTLFDVDSPVTFAVTVDPLSGPASFALNGPSGLVSIPYDVNRSQYFSTGMLQPGRYNLSASASNNGKFNLQMTLGSLALIPRPLVLGGQTIEAEAFDEGAEGVAYHDTTPQNLGAQYRPTAVDINPGGSYGYNLGYTAPGEWLKYSLTNPTAGDFLLQSAVASSKPGGTFHVEIDNQNVTGPLTVPDTADWYNFQTLVSPKFHVSPGDHTMKVVMDTAGASGAIGNFDCFRFVPTGVVTLVSQQRSVSASAPNDPTSSALSKKVQSEPGNFGSFVASVGSSGLVGAEAQQSSDFNVTATGARFPVAGNIYVYQGSGAATSYQVVFDVNSPAPYTIDFKPVIWAQFGVASLSLQGPAGPVFVYNPSQGNNTGTLQAGRYTLSTGILCNSNGVHFTLDMDLGSAITPADT